MAAIRELREETGIVSAEFIAEVRAKNRVIALCHFGLAMDPEHVMHFSFIFRMAEKICENCYYSNIESLFLHKCAQTNLNQRVVFQFTWY